MDRLIIAHEVAQQLPQMLVVVITAKGVSNSGPNEKVEKFAAVRFQQKADRSTSIH